MPIDLSNESFVQDNKVGASDSANASGVLSSSARDGGVSLGIGAQLGNTLNYGSITQTDGGAFDLARDLTGSYGATLADLVAKQNEAAKESTSLVAGLVDKFGAMVESRNTGGESSSNKIVLYIALAAAAVLGIFFWRKAK